MSKEVTDQAKEMAQDRSSSWPVPAEFLRTGQDPTLVQQSYQAAMRFLSQYGNPGEEIKFIAVSTDTANGGESALVTDRRLITCKNLLTDDTDLDDCLWQDVSDIQLNDSPGGATLAVETIQSWELAVQGLPRAQTQILYDYGVEHSDRVRNRLKLDGFKNSGILPNAAGQAAPVRVNPYAEPSYRASESAHANHLQTDSTQPGDVTGPFSEYSNQPPAGLPTRAVRNNQSGDSQPISTLTSTPLSTLPQQPAQPSSQSMLQNVMRAQQLAQGPESAPAAPPKSVLQSIMRATQVESAEPPAPLPPSPYAASAEHSTGRGITRPQTNGNYNGQGFQPSPYPSSPQLPQPLAPPAAGGDYTTGLLYEPNYITPDQSAHPSDPMRADSSGEVWQTYLPQEALPDHLGAAQMFQSPPNVSSTRISPASNLGQSGEGEASPPEQDTLHKMRQLRELLDAGLITEEDYKKKKADILARL